MKIKALREKRAAKIEMLDNMVAALENNGEVRSLTEEEAAEFRALEKEVKDIDATINAIEVRRAMESDKPEEMVKEVEEKRNIADAEVRALNAFFRGEDLDAEVRKL